MSDEFNPHCKFCTKNYYVDNQNRFLNKQKIYYKLNLDKINTQQNEKNIYKTDINFHLICRTRHRNYQALRGKIKSSSTINTIGIVIET